MRLADLDTVDWSAFQHAYGPATDVPGLIRDLASRNRKTSEKALGVLGTNIHHQGTVFPASVQAMPFLVELLVARETTHRDLVAMLVAALMTGKGYCQVHWSKPMINPFSRKPMKPPPDLAERIAAEERIVRGVLEHGRLAIPSLLPFLEHEDAYFRGDLAKALARYPDDAASIAPALRRALAVEGDDETRNSIENAMRDLLGQPAVEKLPDAALLLEQWLAPWVGDDAQMVRQLTFDASTMRRVATAMVGCVICEVMTLPNRAHRDRSAVNVLASHDPFASDKSLEVVRSALRDLQIVGAPALFALVRALEIRNGTSPKEQSQAWFNLFGGPNLRLAVERAEQAGADRVRIVGALSKTLRALCVELTPQ